MKSQLSAILCTLIFVVVGTSADPCAAQCKRCPDGITSACGSVMKSCHGKIIETTWSTTASGSSAQFVTSVNCCNFASGATDLKGSLSHGVTTGFQHCQILGSEVEFAGLVAGWTITQNNELCWTNTSVRTVSNESTVPGGRAMRLSLVGPVSGAHLSSPFD